MEEPNNKIEKVFMESYEEFSDAIFRYCLFQTSHKETALDLTQDTFTKTWLYLQKGERVENIKAFLYRVAKNLIIDHRRKKKSSSLDEMIESGTDFSEGEDPLTEKEKKFERDHVIKTIHKIDENYREILLMRYVEEMSIKEIADILEMSDNHVSVSIHRGTHKLKKLLAKED